MPLIEKVVEHLICLVWHTYGSGDLKYCFYLLLPVVILNFKVFTLQKLYIV